MSCADALGSVIRTSAMMNNLPFIIPPPPRLRGREKWGRASSPPRVLEHCRQVRLERLVCTVPMALAAELRRLVRARGCAARVVGSNQEEHGGVGARGLAAVSGSHVHRVHGVLVVAGRAHDNRDSVVV